MKSGKTGRIMKKSLRKTMRSIAPIVEKAVKEIHDYAKKHPGTVAASTALDGILDHLIQEILRSKTDEGENKMTIRLLEELTTIFPKSPLPWLHLSKVCIDMDKDQEALGFAEAGLKVDPSCPDLIFNRALCLQNTGRLREAIAEFRRYIKSNPDNPWAYNNIGDAYRSLRRYDQAERYLNMAIRYDNKFVPAYRNLALLYMDQKDWANCVRCAKIAEELGPPDKEIQLALGDAYMGLRDPEAALRHLVEATLINKYFVEAYETMSVAYADLRRYEFSIVAAKEALKWRPDNWMALANIAYSYSKQGRFADAIEFQLKALKHAPDQEKRYKLCWNLGWNYFLTDEYDKALEFTDAAIRIKEFPDISLYFNRGLILFAQGKLHKAEAVYSKAGNRARKLGNSQAILEGVRDFKDFISKKGIKADPDFIKRNITGKDSARKKKMKVKGHKEKIRKEK